MDLPFIVNHTPIPISPPNKLCTKSEIWNRPNHKSNCVISMKAVVSKAIASALFIGFWGLNACKYKNEQGINSNTFSKNSLFIFPLTIIPKSLNNLP